jgi:hypothetical protein
MLFLHCLSFKGQTTSGVSTKLYRSDQYHPMLIFAAQNGRQNYKINRKILFGFKGQLLAGF